MTPIATHGAPAWGPKSDVLIHADLTAAGRPGESEPLWARRLSATTYKICCIPFLARGLALGDKVETDGERVIRRVIEKSGHRTLRIAIADTSRFESLQKLLRSWLASVGVLHEWFTGDSVAIDLPATTPEDSTLEALAPFRTDGALLVESDSRPLAQSA